MQKYEKGLIKERVYEIQVESVRPLLSQNACQSCRRTNRRSGVGGMCTATVGVLQCCWARQASVEGAYQSSTYSRLFICCKSFIYAYLCVYHILRTVCMHLAKLHELVCGATWRMSDKSGINWRLIARRWCSTVAHVGLTAQNQLYKWHWC